MNLLSTIMRRLEALEANRVVRTYGTITDVSPLSAVVGAATSPVEVLALDSYSPTVGDQVAILDTAADRLVLGHVGAGAAAEWDDWTPYLDASTTDPTLGSGSSVAGRFVEQADGTVHGWGLIAFGTSGVAAGSGNYMPRFPVAPASGAGVHPVGTATLNDANTNEYKVATLFSSGIMRCDGFGIDGIVTNATPWTWAANDSIFYEFSFEREP